MANISRTSLEIVELTVSQYSAFAAHMLRHRAESGRNGFHFMPFAADDPEGPVGVEVENLAVPFTEPGWERAYVAVEPATRDVVGHVCIKGGKLRSMLHRCDIGLGVEAHHRRRGIGETLMHTAIGFARQQPRLAWMDLSTFAHNVAAQHLYQKLGFQQVGLIPDRVRIGDAVIGDVLMTLALR